METVHWNWNTRDGLKMYSESWKPEAPKALVVLIHGHGEHINRYQHVAKAFSDAGYALAGYDLRGHGKSEGARGHIPAYDSLMMDISDFIADVKSKFPGLPVFLYGHSMGGNQVINFVLRNPAGLKGVIATGPWIKLAFDPPAAQVMVAKVLNNLLPSFTMASGLDQAALSRDPNVVSAYASDPLVHDKVSVRLYTGMYSNGLAALERAAELKLPMLLMHGSGDKITSHVASQEFAKKAGKMVDMKVWDGFYHEIHNEPEKDAVIQSMIQWMDHLL